MRWSRAPILHIPQILEIEVQARESAGGNWFTVWSESSLQKGINSTSVLLDGECVAHSGCPGSKRKVGRCRLDPPGLLMCALVVKKKKCRSDAQCFGANPVCDIVRRDKLTKRGVCKRCKTMNKECERSEQGCNGLSCQKRSNERGKLMKTGRCGGCAKS